MKNKAIPEATKLHLLNYIFFFGASELRNSWVDEPLKPMPIKDLHAL